MTPEEHLAVPYVMVMESVRDAKGDWYRRAEYPELGVAGEAYSPLDAIDKLETARVEHILTAIQRGESVPVPRAPLRSGQEGINAERLGFAKWLVDQNRLGEPR